MKHWGKRGFTLLEMTIVLMIIGVLIGGITIGVSMLATSRLQTVMTDVDNYTTAVSNFKQMYQALPGDFITATTVWGTDNLTCPTGGGTSGTCNGDGNGQLTNGNGASKAGETFQFWQHLKLAGMFSKPAKNQAGSGGAYDSTIGTNVPAGPLRGSGFSVYWLGTISSGNANYFWDRASSDTGDSPYGHVFYFGKQVSGASTYGPVLTPDQAASIDAKTDDGSPATGKVRAMISTSALNPGCTTTAVPSTAAYNTSSTSVLCSLLFVMGF
jgi:prepilin-type N-terminal cleavage/methylation domain-containing protein